jgi:DNA repair exonuclease SbcCD nuclease subunit
MRARFLHTGDWQLGIRRYYLDEAAQADFAAARLNAVERIVALAEQEGCDFVVVCGDVFESNQVDPKTKARALEAMRGATPVYLLPGNHDPLDATAVYRSTVFETRRPDNVHLLDGRVLVRPELELVGAPWTSKRPTGDPLAAVYELPPASGALRVVAGHGQVDRGHPKPQRADLIRLDRLEEALEEGQFDFVALGDRHSASRVGDSGRVWYAGSPEPTDFNEERPGYVLLVELSEEAGEVEERAVGRWRFAAREAELTGPAAIESLAAWLDGFEDKRATIVRLALSGQLTLRDHARLEEALASYRDLFAALDRAAGSGVTVVPDRLDEERLALSGFAQVARETLQLQARGDGEEAEAARGALGLLYRLVRESTGELSAGRASSAAADAPAQEEE